jgi:predicted DNA-binding transcriptional regulator AlpA
MPQRELGVKRGQHWADRAGSRFPLVRCIVLKPGEHYYAPILIRPLEGDEAGEERWVRRVKIPCKWEDVDAYLETHPDVPREFVAPHRSEPDDSAVVEAPLPIGVAAMRKIVREEIRDALGIPKIAYTIDEAAAACGTSRSSIYKAIKAHQLVPRYFGTKPFFQEEELRRWIASLPDEPA